MLVYFVLQDTLLALDLAETSHLLESLVMPGARPLRTVSELDFGLPLCEIYCFAKSETNARLRIYCCPLPWPKIRSGSFECSKLSTPDHYARACYQVKLISRIYEKSFDTSPANIWGFWTQCYARRRQVSPGTWFCGLKLPTWHNQIPRIFVLEGKLIFSRKFLAWSHHPFVRGEVSSSVVWVQVRGTSLQTSQIHCKNSVVKRARLLQ